MSSFHIGICMLTYILMHVYVSRFVKTGPARCRLLAGKSANKSRFHQQCSCLHRWLNANQQGSGCKRAHHLGRQVVGGSHDCLSKVCMGAQHLQEAHVCRRIRGRADPAVWGKTGWEHHPLQEATGTAQAAHPSLSALLPISISDSTVSCKGLPAA